MIRRNTCFLCQRELAPHPFVDGVQVHPVLPEAERDCLVKHTDPWGVAIEDEQIELVANEIAARAPQAPREPEPGEIVIDLYPFVDVLMEQFFAERGLARLGGKSSGRGWSSFALWQRCAYAWKRRYLDAAPAMIPIEAPSLAIGSLVHAHLALYYSQLIGDSPYRGIFPEHLHDALIGKANPELLNEAWRIFSAYKLYYHLDAGIQPLAIEFDLRDPRNGESCRYDMVAFQPEQVSNRPPGTYIWEHKTAGRFDDATLTGWTNDGEILGEVMLWRRLGLDKRFGDLRGVVVNILGKQPKDIKFHREYVAPSSLQLEQHAIDLKHHEGLIQLARSTGIFPRSRNNCIGRYGKCDRWEECSLSDLSVHLMLADGR